MTKLIWLLMAVGISLASCAENIARKEYIVVDDPFSRSKINRDLKSAGDSFDKSPSAKKYVEYSGSVSASPAVLALMKDARFQSSEGNLDLAITTLERAIRIQPRNANLWYQLAVFKLKQEKPRLAEDLAKKSNSLAGDNSDLRRKNWTIIASARRELGDRKGALEAERKAAQY